MNTAEMINLLQKYQLGGATGRPREVYICVGEEVYDTNVESVGTGDGLLTELFLHLKQERKSSKTGRWIEVDDHYNRISGRCSMCGWEALLYETDVVGMDYCPNCGAKMDGRKDEYGDGEIHCGGDDDVER